MEEKPLSACSDEELANVFRQGRVEGFNLLVGRYKNPLVNFVYRYLGDYDEANDVVQDTFVRVYHHIDQYKPVAKFSTWLYTIATNLARTQYRKRTKWGIFSFKNRHEDEDEPRNELVDTKLLPDELVDSAFLHERIEDALLELAEPYREVVILFEIEEKSYEEICDITGLNIGTVKSRLNRGRAKLQELLKDLMEK